MVLLIYLTGEQSPVLGAPIKTLRRQIPAGVGQLKPLNRLAATQQMKLSIGLPLRNETELDQLIQQLSDPTSTNYHRYLSPDQFAARFGPTEADYAAVSQFVKANGFTVLATHSNRLVLDVAGSAAATERAFQVRMNNYQHPRESRQFICPDGDPSLPADLPVATVEGLSDYYLPRPMSRFVKPQSAKPLAGTGPGGCYAGNDFRNAYIPGTPLTGKGQTVGLLQFSAYYKSDITNYENTAGITNYVPLTDVIVSGTAPSTANNAEVALDIEMAISMAPGLSRVIVYQMSWLGPSSILSRMANDNLAKQLSCSWIWSGGPSATVDSILKQMAAQGQSFFQASGDNDAYTGAQSLDIVGRINSPVDSTNLTAVGGTTLSMNNGSWAGETVWNYSSYGGSSANIGSGGGVSTYYALPWWQANIDPVTSQGSSTYRNVPDVALTADAVYVAYNNGSSGGMAGTSCAAPLWAGFCALINQQATASGNTNNVVGFLNPALYALATNANYTACFHDITTGNNIGTNSAGMYYATNGYDLCTGLGTPNGTNLVNALAPKPGFVAQPLSRSVVAGSNLTLTATVVGAPPISFQWRFAGTNLPDATNNVLAYTPVTTNQAGNYTLVLTNVYGAITSSVATINVGQPPVITAAPTNVVALAGSNVTFSVSAIGTSPLTYRWLKNGTNFSSTATNSTLTLTAVTTNNSGNYTVVVTNLYGAVASAASQTVVQAPGLAVSGLTNRTLECSLNTNVFTATVSGTLPLSIQWTLDGVPIAGATNTSFALTNLSLPSHTVAVTVTNLYGSVTSNAVLTVTDTLPPVITLAGVNPFYLELGSAYVEPGATAADTCAGSLAVVISGVVNTDAPSTNLLTYTANDGNGNLNTATRTVIVRDTTPPTITWYLTNLVLSADSNCVALLPDLTGTNAMLASDLSGSVTITQSPTNQAALSLGTNLVVLTAADPSGNCAYATNWVVVQDATPPQILGNPVSQTNLPGTTASFSVAATACTPLTYQWYFNATALTAATNSSLPLSNLTTADAGNYYVVAQADGGATTSAVASLVIQQLGVALNLVSSVNPAGYRDGLTFTAGVAPTNATGTIAFLTNGVAFDTQPLAAGLAVSASLATLPRGTQTVTAVYSGDLVYSAATNALAQVITNHPPVTPALSLVRYAGSPLSLALTNLAGGWSDADGDPLTLVAVTTSTNGVTVTNTGTALIYPNADNVADQFTCLVTDGWGATNAQVITLTIQRPTITSMVARASGLTLQLSGAPGATYILEGTTNLCPPVWVSVGTNVLGADGVWQFTDPDSAVLPQRFYRLRLSQ
jgi:hypothetical protein